MNESLPIPINFQGSALQFDARFFNYGYSHRVEVNINGIPVIFEPDEERNYRALVSAGQLEANSSTLNIGLLQAIAARLEAGPSKKHDFKDRDSACFVLLGLVDLLPGRSIR
ncbi:hypothetical protein [Mucilaginibacter sp. FT3.2]|uniref:hypothetical protein n=1 Tax=Mucilaginibacter sp. FT3.2 TaxID=2723090 RepID=UPI0016153F6C|nr:hypothetical protein [Mucilaginibacter sp. FT3.2]MBB6234292.1 hypothetical protein [Mucilaginibacter sp. FT3.2]